MSTSALSSLSSNGSTLQLTGLASGLDTTSIINALMAIDRKPVTALTNQQKGLQALNSQLTSIQTSLQQVALNAQALGDVSLFANTQQVTSSDTTKITAAASTGAGVGGYQVNVTQLAQAAQRTFAFASPAAAETITIDGHSTAIAAGASITDFVNSINSDANATVYAAATSTGTVVLSERATGAQTGSYIQVAGDTQPVLTENAALARAGQNAAFSVDGGATQYSSSNTVTNAVAGVSLTFQATTNVSGPVTINVQPPAPDPNAISAAVKTFVDSYNGAISQITAQLNQKTSTSDPTVGTLFGDTSLSNLLSNMRQSIYSSISGLTGITSLGDIGVSTGAAATAGYSQSAVDGKLAINSDALTAALQSNPNGVKQMLQSWSNSFYNLVNGASGATGTITTRIQGDNAQLSDISDQIDNLNSMLNDRQAALQTQFATLEATLSTLQSQNNWLASQIAGLSSSSH